MVLKFFLFFLVLISFSTFAETLTKEENIYFSFIDLNNDNNISFNEADQILKLIFQLLDEDNNKMITKEEIIELKNIIISLS